MSFKGKIGQGQNSKTAGTEGAVPVTGAREQGLWQCSQGQQMGQRHHRATLQGEGNEQRWRRRTCLLGMSEHGPQELKHPEQVTQQDEAVLGHGRASYFNRGGSFAASLARQPHGCGSKDEATASILVVIWELGLRRQAGGRARL